MYSLLAAVSHTAVGQPFFSLQKNSGHSRYSKQHPWCLDFPENVSHHSYCLLLLFLPRAVYLGKDHCFASRVDTGKSSLCCELEMNHHLSCPSQQKDLADGIMLWEKTHKAHLLFAVSDLQRGFRREGVDISQLVNPGLKRRHSSEAMCRRQIEEKGSDWKKYEPFRLTPHIVE